MMSDKPQVSTTNSDEIMTLNTQGGGHGQLLAAKNSRLGIDCVAKPLFKHENHFYRVMSKTPLVDCLPQYCGKTVYNGSEYLLIEDLTAGMTSPCIADLKLGTRSFEIGVPESKRLKQLQNMSRSTSPKYAVRVIDVSLRKNGSIVKRWDRNYGKKASLNSLIDTLNKFIPTNRREEFIAKVENVINKLTIAKEMYPGSRLYSASLLVCYDSDSPNSPMRVVLIDFAHAYCDITKSGGKLDAREFDDNTLLGLRNIVHIFNSPNEIEERTNL
ncbi:inositol hexakisphosphate kinase, putative [Trichomonas vaginalis G3]|uniref:Kinase n=1 Tax=Trichomonas vaginalis (strain ATCC PRA-98 / G3) TaxID=412133 RepID=A2G0H7_TRIV3|nr:inositol phosphate biosynthetic process [Trichomonas vaginalis G3]EAX89334.1 inositol hexakisphosphate kinase, putative [Trichomonas vaginalis G3]KAI5495840.1 inositol phosphate biosynthetic process [Trichomonas vaginalis G3]|eukprot:XP_001302264.1 inositol hexakisphosphate kinase [Trichomonas vaginalis G3]